MYLNISIHVYTKVNHVEFRTLELTYSSELSCCYVIALGHRGHLLGVVKRMSNKYLPWLGYVESWH